MSLTAGQEGGSQQGCGGRVLQTESGCGGEGLCVETAHSRRETDGARGQVASVTDREIV